ncbi:hypothetical protein Tco_1224173, partial [Tanacetum coccineum]
MGSSMKCNSSSTWISSSGIARGSSAKAFLQIRDVKRTMNSTQLL